MKEDRVPMERSRGKSKLAEKIPNQLGLSANSMKESLQDIPDKILPLLDSEYSTPAVLLGSLERPPSDHKVDELEGMDPASNTGALLSNGLEVPSSEHKVDELAVMDPASSAGALLSSGLEQPPSKHKVGEYSRSDNFLNLTSSTPFHPSMLLAEVGPRNFTEGAVYNSRSTKSEDEKPDGRPGMTREILRSTTSKTSLLDLNEDNRIPRHSSCLQNFDELLSQPTRIDHQDNRIGSFVVNEGYKLTSRTSHSLDSYLLSSAEKNMLSGTSSSVVWDFPSFGLPISEFPWGKFDGKGKFDGQSSNQLHVE